MTRIIPVLKTWIKQALGAFRLEIRRTQRRRDSFEGFLAHVKNLGFEPETSIDVGVAHGTFELYTSFPDATHLLIEPIQEFEGVMRHISRKFNKVEYVIAAASNTPGTVEINVHKDLSGSSTLKETSGTHVDGVPRQVPTVKIDDLCHERQLKGPYLIKIDVQGAELNVLDGAQEVLKETELVILEVSLFQFFTNGPQFFDVVSYMKERNFVVYDIFGGHLRPLDGALAQVDIAFAKADGVFRKSREYATIPDKSI